MVYTVYTKIIVVLYKQQVSNGQELGQSEPKSCPHNQNGKKQNHKPLNNQTAT